VQVLKPSSRKYKYKIAKTYLNQNLPTDEIAYLVGYTETSSFLRSFKKWTGQTVNQFKNNKYL
jgi:AraC-like DNA-binding protein